MPPPLLRRPIVGSGALHRRFVQTRSFVDARVKWVRDRGLDHAVEKEKHLLPFHSLKDLFLLNPSSSSSSTHSLPLSFIAARRHDLRLPFRPIRFIRLFPSAFLEEDISSAAVPHHPHIRPTDDLIRAHADEQLAVAASSSDTADRLLRLLMLSPRRRLPLALLDRLRFDLGLPRHYPRDLLPLYPDCFRLVPAQTPENLDLELVCYRKDLAVSAMEDLALRTGGYKKGAPLAFPMDFPRGFDLEKKVKLWVEDWQKLPYISPYEDGSVLPPNSDVLEKWTVGVLHELLHLLVSKKTEKENLILLGEHVGLPPGFRMVITHHPGIFYVSNKLRTQTVVLREAYRRDLLVEKHPLMGSRYHYIHLMHKGKEPTSSTSGGKKDRKPTRDSIRSSEGSDGLGIEDEDDNDDEDEDVDDEEEDAEDFSGNSGTEMENEESDDDDIFPESAVTNLGDTPRKIGVKNATRRRPQFPRMNSIERSLWTSKSREYRYGKTESRQEVIVGMESRERANHQSRMSTSG